MKRAIFTGFVLLLILAACGGSDAAVRTFQVEPFQPSAEDLASTVLPPVEDRSRAGLLLLGDPFTFPMVDYLEALNRELPGVPAAGATQLPNGTSSPRKAA